MSASWLVSGVLNASPMPSFPATSAEDVIDQPMRAQFEAFLDEHRRELNSCLDGSPRSRRADRWCRPGPVAGPGEARDLRRAGLVRCTDAAGISVRVNPAVAAVVAGSGRH